MLHLHDISRLNHCFDFGLPSIPLSARVAKLMHLRQTRRSLECCILRIAVPRIQLPDLPALSFPALSFFPSTSNIVS